MIVRAKKIESIELKSGSSNEYLCYYQGTDDKYYYDIVTANNKQEVEERIFKIRINSR